MPQLATAELRDLEVGYRSSDDTLMRLAQRSMKAFFSYVMRDEQTGAPVEFAPIHETWHRLADQHDRLMLWAAMESGKTQSLSVARTLWELGRDPTLRFAIISNTSGMAVKIANQIGKYITQSEELHRVFPHLEPDPTMPWNSEQLTVKRPTLSKDPSVNTLGIGSNTQGARIDRAVLDDVLNRENTRTQYMRDESQDWYLKTIPGRMTERGRILGVGNAWNPDDLYHRLVKNPRWKGYKFPILKADGTSAWPTVWPLDRIERRRQELGPMESMSQLMCQPIDDAMSRFKREWIETCLRRGEGKDVVYALRGIPFGCKLYCGVDLAVGRKEHHDRTAFFVLLIHPNGDRQVLWVESGRMLATDIMEKVKDLSLRFGGIFVIENVAAQDYLVQILQGSTAIPIVPFATGKNKADPTFGLEAMAAEFAAGKWIIPNRGGVCHPEVQEWVNEMLGYNPAAHSGDRLMAAWFAKEGERLSVPVAKPYCGTVRLKLNPL